MVFDAVTRVMANSCIDDGGEKTDAKTEAMRTTYTDFIYNYWHYWSSQSQG